ncbi:hypothetical protein FGO68_gene7218 [Halteria grandinella]|uniref:Uncharacterized protein n=1 Tax=Halteria grandinella TaxID=5974 RepID=A0A8J8T5P8_HALGN|nr:hypothetical protein FGO68_gene7218 [Halteria grandinella]
MRSIVNDFQVILSDEDDEMVVVSPNHKRMKSTKVYIEQIEESQEESKEVAVLGRERRQPEPKLAPLGSGQDSSLIPQSAKSGKSDELRIKGANIEQDQFSLEGNSEICLKKLNILELAAIGQISLLEIVDKGIKHFEILRDPNNNKGYEDLLDYLQSLNYNRKYVILTFQNNEMAKITRLCSTFCLSHLSFQLRRGPVKEKLLIFLSLLAKNQQQTIIDASDISELSQEQLLIICRRMEMHGHKDLKAADYIGKNEGEIKDFYELPIIADKDEYKKQYFVKESNSRIYIFKPDHYVIKTPKQTIEQVQGNISSTLENLFVEQQMIQVVAYNDANILTQMSEVIVLKNKKIFYYLAYKPLYELYEEIRDPTRLLRDSVLLASYLSDLHLRTRLYHGDIKPANIFMYPYGIGLLRTDSDSLVSLFHKTNTSEEVYQIKSYTKGYASEQLVSLLEGARLQQSQSLRRPSHREIMILYYTSLWTNQRTLQ